MQSQRGLKRDTQLTKCVLGAHPIIEHFMEKLRMREALSTYLPGDKRMKLEDDKVITLLIHNIVRDGGWRRPDRPPHLQRESDR